MASSDGELDRRAVAHDLWPRRLLERRACAPPTLPARVAWPTSEQEVRSLVVQARRERRSLVPFGAGSGVCGGISPDPRAIVVDMKRMNRLVEFDALGRRITVEAGMLGEHLERLLNARGFTLGHFPSSIYCSTVGGWAATRSAGQLSSRFGKIEDLIVALAGVDGCAEPVYADVRDPETGPGALRLLVGSEGALCLLTRVTLRIRPLASHRWLRGFSFATLNDALSAVRACMMRGEAPSVLRLYDPVDTWLSGGVVAPVSEPDRVIAGGIARAGLEDSGPLQEDGGWLEAVTARLEQFALFEHPGPLRHVIGRGLSHPARLSPLIDRLAGPCKLIVGIEGGAAEVTDRVPALRSGFLAFGAQDAGDGPGSAWLRHRHRVSYRMARAFAAGAWVDTFEVAACWDDVLPLYHELRRALRRHVVVLCHFSHAYVDGCALYFTFLGGGRAGKGRRSAQARYEETWARALAVVARRGGAVSHHHGIGRSKVAALPGGGGHRQVLRALKRAFDPEAILNPGVLGVP